MLAVNAITPVFIFRRDGNFFSYLESRYSGLPLYSSSFETQLRSLLQLLAGAMKQLAGSMGLKAASFT